MIDPTRAQIIYALVDMRPANVNDKAHLASIRFTHSDRDTVQDALDNYQADSTLGETGYDWRLATIVIEPKEDVKDS